MDLRSSIRSARNNLAFKVYNISDKFHDAYSKMRMSEIQSMEKVMEYLPLPSKVANLAKVMAHNTAELLCVLCERCQSAPCCCDRHNSLKWGSKE